MARPGPGERVAADEGLGQAELAAEHADLVLEQFAQRLDQLHVHPLGQAADIVVALDRHRRAAGEADALDHVGIERALGEEVGAADLLRLGLEHVDEGLADELALGLGVGEPGEPAEEVARSRPHGPAGCCSCCGTGRRPARPRPAASARDRRTRRSAGRRSLRGSAPRRPRCRRRRTGRRSPCRCRPGRGSRRSWHRGNSAIVQSPAQPQTWRTKLASSLPPSGVCTTSGWNIRLNRASRPRRWRSRKGAPSELATTWKPRRKRSTRSPWLIHTWWLLADFHSPSNSAHVVDDLDEGAAELALVGRRRPCRRAAAPSSAGRSRCRGSAGRCRRDAAARAGCRPASPRPGRRRG